MKKELFRNIKRMITIVEHYRLFILRNKFGLSPELYMELDLPWVTMSGINTVIDIGAHTGKWSRTVHHLLPKASIYSFEPIPKSYKVLEERMKGIENYEGFNTAVGSEDGITEFNLNEFPASSSLRNVSKIHVEAFPVTKNTRKTKVKVGRLDNLINIEKLKREILIKVDVQGFEDKVIEGGEKIFTKAKILIIELSFTCLYENQPLFDDINSRLKDLGFIYKGNLDQIASPKTGEILQADAIFIKRNS